MPIGNVGNTARGITKTRCGALAWNPAPSGVSCGVVSQAAVMGTGVLLGAGRVTTAGTPKASRAESIEGLESAITYVLVSLMTARGRRQSEI